MVLAFLTLSLNDRLAVAGGFRFVSGNLIVFTGNWIPFIYREVESLFNGIGPGF